MSSKRSNFYLSEEIEKRAQAIIKERGFDGLTDCLKTLIREEYERRHPPTLHDTIESPPPPRPSGPVNYKIKTKKHGQ